MPAEVPPGRENEREARGPEAASVVEKWTQPLTQTCLQVAAPSRAWLKEMQAEVLPGREMEAQGLEANSGLGYT